MLRTVQAPYAILSAMLAMCGWLAMAHVASGQSSMGGFGNFGLGSESGLGALRGNSGTSPLQGSLSPTGTMSGQSGMGGQAGAMPSLGGGGALGSSFDAGFGATQMASSLATAAAVSRLSGASMGGRGGFGGGGFGGGRGGFGGNNNMNQNAQNEKKVRAVIRIGFPVDRPSSSYTSERINQRFATMPLPPSVANVQIVMDGRTAVLQGQVAALADASLIERLLALEPGIDDVRNELTLAGAGNPSQQVPTPAPQR